MIKRLRKEQLWWPVSRWIVIFNGFLWVGLCWALVPFAIHHYHETSRIIDTYISMIGKLPSDQNNKRLVELMIDTQHAWRDEVLELVIFIPVWFIMAMFALKHFAIVLVHWRGHADRVLLLKLIDAQQIRVANDTHPP